MKTSILLSAWLLAAQISYGGDGGSAAKLLRLHWRGYNCAGQVYEWSDLFFSGTVDGVVTLWKSPAGDMLIFRQSDLYSKRVTSFGASNVKTHDYIRGGYRLAYEGATPDDARANLEKLPPAAYKGVSFTVATNHFRASLPLEHWHTPAGKATRNALRERTSAAFIRNLRQELTNAALFGSPAGHLACEFFLDIVADDATCQRDQTLKRELETANCDFDAQFGYPAADMI
jgi:hypothetical protein